METKPTTTGQHLSVHEAITDSVLRNAQGIDQDDVSLMASAFTEDAIQDMTAFQFLDPQAGVVRGREAITEMASSSVGKLDTMHMTSNFRTWVSDDGNTARLTCYALAQHWRPGRAKSPATKDYFLMGNKYEAELVLDGNQWKMNKFAIKPQWTQGDPEVFNPSTW